LEEELGEGVGDASVSIISAPRQAELSRSEV